MRDGVVEMRYVGGGWFELVLVLSKFLQCLTRYTNTSIFFMNSDAFLCKTLSFMRVEIIQGKRTVIIAFHEGWAIVVLAAGFFAVVFFTVDALEVLGALAAGEAEVLEDMLLIG
jgi:hypothetical protein